MEGAGESVSKSDENKSTPIGGAGLVGATLFNKILKTHFPYLYAGGGAMLNGDVDDDELVKFPRFGELVVRMGNGTELTKGAGFV